MNILLWILQILAALFFTMAGAQKAFRPLNQLAKRMPFVTQVPQWFVRFIGVAELLGAIGLIIPAATGIVPGLTVAAAFCLAFVMVSATIYHATHRQYKVIGLPLVPLAVTLIIAVARSHGVA